MHGDCYSTQVCLERRDVMGLEKKKKSHKKYSLKSHQSHMKVIKNISSFIDLYRLVFMLVVRSLQMVSLTKRRAKQVARFCSVSAIKKPLYLEDALLMSAVSDM